MCATLARHVLTAAVSIGCLCLAASAGALTLDPPEEVLQQAVLLTWSDAAPAPLHYTIKRKPPKGGWLTIAEVPGTQTSYIDPGPVPPGEYRYRVSVGEVSSTQSFRMSEECAGQEPTPADLPIVPIVNSDGDEDYDGEDVVAALEQCSALRGCVLRGLRDVVYQDVSVELHDPAYDFSNGLVVEGYGSTTVFRSPLYDESDHDPALCQDGMPTTPFCYRPEPVFSVRPGLDGVRFRNFTIDGRKQEQPDPGNRGDTWTHDGIRVWASTLEYTDGGCVHNVTARNLMTGGVRLGRARRWILEYSTVEDVGCQDGLTSCDALTELTPELHGFPGYRSPGFGILSDVWTEETVIRHSRVERASKYGLGLYEATHSEVHDNVVRSARAAGICCNQCTDATIQDNVVEDMWCHEDFEGHSAAGISVYGDRVVVRGNALLEGDGSGLDLSGSVVTAEDNLLEGNCGAIDSSAVIHVADDVVFRNNTVSDPAEGCRFSLLIGVTNDVLVEGLTLTSGPETVVGILVDGAGSSNVSIRTSSLEGNGSTGTGIHYNSYAQGGAVYDSVCIAGFPTRLVDASGTVEAGAPDPEYRRTRCWKEWKDGKSDSSEPEFTFPDPEVEYPLPGCCPGCE
jgi:hypothetical protein